MTLSHAHIVIIDEDQATLDVLSLVLEEAGLYRVTATPHVFDEVTALEHLHPDPLMVDVLLPAP